MDIERILEIGARLKDPNFKQGLMAEMNSHGNPLTETQADDLIRLAKFAVYARKIEPDISTEELLVEFSEHIKTSKILDTLGQGLGPIFSDVLLEEKSLEEASEEIRQVANKSAK